MEKVPAVYMMSNKKDGVIYIGVTSDLPRRVAVHKSHEINGFSKRYNTDKLVWYRCYGTMEEAITAEKRLKAWRRAWKIREIEKVNNAVLNFVFPINSRFACRFLFRRSARNGGTALFLL